MVFSDSILNLSVNNGSRDIRNNYDVRITKNYTPIKEDKDFEF